MSPDLDAEATAGYTGALHYIDPCHPEYERLCQLAKGTLEVARRHHPRLQQLLSIGDRRYSLLLCHRDLHREHVLFEDGQPCGLIDWGALGIDSPACDVARLLGSLVPDDSAAWHDAIDAYRQFAPLDDGEEELSWRLDQIGCMIAALHWLEWIVVERRHFVERVAALERWETLLRRLQGWS